MNQTPAFPVGDVSGDYTVSAYDAALILQFVVGLIDEFPVQNMMGDSPGNVVPSDYEISIPQISLKAGQRVFVPISESRSIKTINGLVTVLPGEFRLHQNYPNPFNPETWIPYDLAGDANVEITIYNAQGDRIRTLSLGAQPAGSYLTKDKAAYWDGRSDTGELVSSGIYLYHLKVREAIPSIGAGEFRATKKMIILK